MLVYMVDIIILIVLLAFAILLAPLGTIGKSVLGLLTFGVFINITRHNMGFEDDEEIDFTVYLPALISTAFYFYVMSWLLDLFKVRI